MNVPWHKIWSSDATAKSRRKQKPRPPFSLERLEHRCLLTHSGGIPDLNSLPGAPVAIYLDFDGHTYSSGTVFRPYDEDGNASSFSTAEQASIREAWRQTAAYFAPFNVNVTTVQPASGPLAWAVLSPDASSWCCNDMFPNYAAQAQVNAADVRSRQSAIAHEVGHSLGLNHQADYDQCGIQTAGYSVGHDALHRPIMGSEYLPTVRKWALGHAESPIELQDDIMRIAAQLIPYTGGDGFRPDDIGDTFATASGLTTANSIYRLGTGVLERLNDVDVHKFNLSYGGTYQITVNRDMPSGVDLKIEIYDASQRLLAAKDGPTNDQQLTMTLAQGWHYIVVSSHGDYGDIGAYKVRVTSMRWQAQDIGYVGYPGYASYDNRSSEFSINGGGPDIWGTADGFHYAHTTLSGDGSIVARVANMSNTDVWAKAGVMIRETLTAGSRHAFMLLTPSNGAYFQSRATPDGGSTTNGGTAGITAPYWVKLVRSGNTFSGYHSSNGVDWILQGSATIAMNSTVQIGLAVTAHNDAKLNTATFGNVLLTGQTGTPAALYNSLATPTGLVLSRGGGTAINLSWNDVSGESGYAIDRSDDGVHWTEIAATGANVTIYSDTGLFGSMRYFYRVAARDPAVGRSRPSTVANIVNRPDAPFNLSVTPVTSTRLVLDWRDVSGETGYRVERSLDGVNFSQIASLGANVTSFADSGPLRGSRSATRFYRVFAISPNGDSAFGSASRKPGTDVPAPWNSTDVGLATAVGQSGWTTYDSAAARFCVNGSGRDIWDVADSFHLAYQTMTGNGEIRARVTYVEGTDPWAKAGVMFRESLNGDAKHAFMLLTPGSAGNPSNGTVFQYRATTGGTSVTGGWTQSTVAAPIAAPVWVKLVRSGSTFRGYRSVDGVNWVLEGSTTITMGSTIYVGLAVTAHNNSTINTSAFTDVSITASAPSNPRRRSVASLPSRVRATDVSTLQTVLPPLSGGQGVLQVGTDMAGLTKSNSLDLQNGSIGSGRPAVRAGFEAQPMILIPRRLAGAAEPSDSCSLRSSARAVDHLLSRDAELQLDECALLPPCREAAKARV
jgi:regulation of enolase protein 1 (concanavalin A-like superfamily)